MFIFDESVDTLLTRCDGLGIDLAASTSTPGRSRVQQVDPAELSPGEFVARRSARRSTSGGAASS